MIRQPRSCSSELFCAAKSRSLRTVGLVAISAMIAVASPSAESQQLGTAPANGGVEWAKVQQALAGRGTMQPGNVLKFSFPRTDLQVVLDGVQLKPALALGSWVAFKRMGSAASSGAMVMGDLVLTEDEVGPVMLALQRGDVEQTALHNHVLRESPRVMYMHIMGRGDAETLAAAIAVALGQSKMPLASPSASAVASSSASSALDLDTAAIARTLRVAGKVNGGVYQMSVPRRERITDRGMEVPPSMGVATAINFQSTGGGRAAITGDFVMTAGEVNPVIRALRAHGIEITALHSHMLTENPRLFFMHFWANDTALKLARGLRVALDRVAVNRR